MSYTATITATAPINPGQNVGKFKKRDVAKSAIQMNSAFVSRMFASKSSRLEGAPSATRDALYSSMRAALSGSFNILQGGQLTPSTTTMYNLMCTKHSKKPNTIDLGDGGKGHWIGDPNAKWVMLYAPGGAFIMPGTFAHFEFMFHCRQRAKKRYADFAVFCLDYSLVPEAVYPTQLRQFVSALRYLLHVQMRSPSQIIVGGDSAGGNLVAALLLHLAQPHPSIPALKLDTPLHAAVMLSPWISFSIETPSFVLNAKKDLLTAPAIAKAGAAYVLGTPPGDVYAEPILATPGMWMDVAEGVVKDVLITGGGNELLVDEIAIFASRVQGGFDEFDKLRGEEKGGEAARELGKSRVEIEVCEGEGHDEVIIDYMSLKKGKGRSAVVLKNWMAEIM